MEKLSHAHGLEDLILLKGPCHTKRPTDSMLSPPKPRCYFSTEMPLQSNPTIHVDPQKTVNGHSDSKQEQQQQAGAITLPDLKTILQSHRNKNSMVLA